MRDNSQMTKKPKPAGPKWRRTHLRAWRMWKKMTLADLAHAMPFNEGTLSEIENGRKRYNQDILEKAAAVLEIPPSYLLDRMPPQPGQPIDYSDPTMIAWLMANLSGDRRRTIGQVIKGLASEQDQTLN